MNFRKENLTVKGDMLQKWAILAADKVKAVNFKASKSWLHRFKVQNKIVSRKITNFLTKKQVDEKGQIKEQANVFVGDLKKYLTDKGVGKIFNTDQSGFNLEMTFGRTLALKGSTKVESLIQSKPSTTHSYTVQPIICSDGTICKKVLIVLKESTGQFGPRVLESLQPFSNSNLHKTCSKSGKMTKELLEEFYRNVLIDYVGKNAVVLCDSWKPQLDLELLKNVSPRDYNIVLKIIPPGTTGIIQPLDVFFFRQLKRFFRKLSEDIRIYSYTHGFGPDDCGNLHLRRSILKLQSLIFNQFQCPRFASMIKYAFQKSGYKRASENKITGFDTPYDYSFNTIGRNDKCTNCTDDRIAYVRCAWCSKTYCLKCFYFNGHTHFG